MNTADTLIVLNRDDVAALMAAVADLEQADADMRIGDQQDAIETLSRIASDIDGQVSTQ